MKKNLFLLFVIAAEVAAVFLFRYLEEQESFLSAVLPAPAFLEELEPVVIVGNSSTYLRFSYANRVLALDSLFANGRILPLTTQKIWEITYADSQGVKHTLNSNQANVPVRLQTASSAAGLSYTFQWDPVAAPSGASIAVSASILFAAASGEFSWTLKTGMPANHALASYRFPDFRIAPLGDKMDDVLAVPFGEGVAIKNPYDELPMNAFSSPGGITLQMFALYDLPLRYGVFLGTRDGAGHRKDFNIGGVNGLFGWEAVGYAPIPAPQPHETPYPVVLRPLQGDWFTAAQEYRAWALTAPMAARGKWVSAQGVSAKVKATRALYLLSPSPDIAANFDQRMFLPEIRAAVDFFKSKNLLIYWYRWFRHPHDAQWPNIEPQASFLSAMREAQQVGVNVLPYFNPGTWDIADPQYASLGVSEYACWGEDGTPIINYNQPTEWRYVWLDPSFPFSVEHERSIIREFAEVRKSDGIYQDFWSGHRPPLCFNTNASHPANGGDYWTLAKRALGENLNQYGKSLRRDFIMTSEAPDENLIPALDMVHTDPFYFFQPPSWLPLPLWSAVYHDYILTSNLGPTFTSVDVDIPLVRIRMAVNYVFGKLPSVHNWMVDKQPFFNQVIGPAHPNRALFDYERNMVQSAFTRPYLIEGQMLRPLPGSFYDTLQYDAALLTKTWSSVWRSPQGKVGVVATNPTADPILLASNINLQSYGFPGSASVRVYRRSTGEAQRTFVAEVPAADPFPLAVTVAPLKVTLIEFE